MVRDHLLLLTLSFFSCKMGRVILICQVSLSWGLNKLMCVEHWVRILAEGGLFGFA